MKNQPNKIYLQTGCDDCEDFKELVRDEITWSEDNIHGNDLEYFSKEYILSVLLSRRRKLRQPNTPEEYKSHIIEIDLVAKWFDIDLFCADFKNEENGTSQL